MELIALIFFGDFSFSLRRLIKQGEPYVKRLRHLERVCLLDVELRTLILLVSSRRDGAEARAAEVFCKRVAGGAERSATRLHELTDVQVITTRPLAWYVLHLLHVASEFGVAAKIDF